MLEMKNLQDDYIINLLHIDEGKKNKLVDLEALNYKDTYYLSIPEVHNLGLETLRIINNRIGKPGNTLLIGSAMDTSKEQAIGNSTNAFNWVGADGSSDAKNFNAFIDKCYTDLSKKGNNPVFLSIGVLNWITNVSRDEAKEVRTPFLIFPIRLIKTSPLSPISIEFINDDIYINPCLIQKLKTNLPEEIIKNFPTLVTGNGSYSAIDEAIDLETLGTGKDYFKKVKDYIDSQRNTSNGDSLVFDFNENIVAISSYNHGDLCMYYDVRNNKEKIVASPLVHKVFDKQNGEFETISYKNSLYNCLPSDSVQNEIIKNAINSESMVIKGPPGTGKTLTIANMIASLLASKKQILVSSKKLAALTEVYEKLPPELKRFCLLLDSESEAEAAKISPKTIKKDLKEAINYIDKYSFDKKLISDRDTVLRSIQLEKTTIQNYYVNLFGGANEKLLDQQILGGSFYDAINHYLALGDENYNTKVFNNDLLAKLSRANLNEYMIYLEKLDKHYQILTHDSKIYLLDNPYYSIHKNSDIDAITSIYNSIDNNEVILDQCFSELSEKYNIYLKDLKLKDIIAIMKGSISKENIAFVLEKKDIINLDQLSLLVDGAILNYNEEIAKNSYQEMMDDYQVLLPFKMDKTITIAKACAYYEELKKFNNSDDFSFFTDERMTKFQSIIDKMDNLSKDCEAHYNNFYNVFKRDLKDEETKKIIDAYTRFIKYEGKEKIGFFDFKAKSLMKEFGNYTFLNTLKLEDVVSAIKEGKEALDIYQEIEGLQDVISSVFQRKVTSDEVKIVREVLEKAKGMELSFAEYMNRIAKELGEVKRIGLAYYQEEDKLNKATLQNITDILLSGSSYQSLKKELMNHFGELIASIDSNNYYGIIDLALGIQGIILLNQYLEDTEVHIYDIYDELQKMDEENHLLEKTNAIMDSIKELANVHMLKNKYTIDYPNICLEILEMLHDELEQNKNNACVGDAISFNDLLEVNNALENKLVYVDAFLEEYENQFARHGLVPYFEKSIYRTAIEIFTQSQLGNKKFDWCNELNESLRKIDSDEEKLRELNTKVLENNIIDSISTKDSSLSFLMHENDDSSLRRLFKNNSEGILKLKKCIIASPSTISLLFRTESFEHFDCVIVDEASQLEPVAILPLLFRSKQVVVVGDEWQMPPIEHFKTKLDRVISNYDEDLQPESSVLSLILKNESFRAYYLECHYRSKTESLIKFSQERFYDRMRTFPAPLPMKEGLGFRDYYLEGAICDGGVNEKEAVKVVELINEHFSRYFKNDKLEESIGVVAFGESQRDKILSLIKNKKELYSKIETAKMNRDPSISAEKVIFFKTIEEVQGQEVNHLILSITYGVDKNGKLVNRFGELNRDKLGQCIFNVAVTRAQSSVTIVHSIRDVQIDEAATRIAYIKEYLAIARYFSQGGVDQFVSSEPVKGFITEVGKFVRDLGINSERIVYNYGVTKGSVRIPVCILNEDLNEAICGIWCEAPTNKTYDYLDYNNNYYHILENRNGWRLMKSYIFDWYLNEENEKEKMKNFVLNALSDYDKKLEKLN